MSNYEDLVKEFCDKCGNGDEHLTLELMKIERLGRIADILDEIEGAISRVDQGIDTLSALGECISVTQYGNFLCVTGGIDVRNMN